MSGMYAYDALLQRVLKETGKPREEIERLVDEKVAELSGLVSREGALFIIANDLGVKVLKDDYSLVRLDELKPGMRDITLIGKVVSIFEPRVFQRDDREGRVQSLILADEHGRVRVSAWHETTRLFESLQAGDIVRITHAYARQGLNGSVEVHLSDRSRIDRNPEGVEIRLPARAFREAVRKRLADITREDVLVNVFGTIVQVFDPYVFRACPECNKKLRETPDGWSCDVHGVQEPVQRGILTVYVDDNSAALRAVFFHEQFERLLPEKEVWEKPDVVKERLLGSFIKLTARVRYNESYDRIELIVQDATLDVDVDEELRLLDELNQPADETEA